LICFDSNYLVFILRLYHIFVSLYSTILNKFPVRGLSTRWCVVPVWKPGYMLLDWSFCSTYGFTLWIL